MPTLWGRLGGLRQRAVRLLWLALFALLVYLPLLLSARAGGRSDLMMELSLATGLVGLSVLVAAAVLPSRVRSLTMAFGIERLLASHRWLALVATGLVLLHVAFVVAADPDNLRLLGVVQAPPRARAATAATVALLGLCGLSLARRRLGTRYEIWRRMHVLLAVSAFLGTALHVIWLNHLMRDPALRGVFTALAGVLGVVAVNRWVVRPVRAARNAYRVSEVRAESASVSTLVLVPIRARGRALRYRPGQFAWLRTGGLLRPGASHPFTIASTPRWSRRLEFTIRHAGDGTQALSQLQPGARVHVDGPYGDFSAELNAVAAGTGPSTGPLILVAGGVGITPMISMLRTMAARRDRRDVRLVVGARSDSDLLFRHELEHLRTHLRLSVVEVVSQGSQAWQGRRGRVDRGVLAQAVSGRRGPTRAQVFVCGPGPMVAATVAELELLGVPRQQVHTELFDMV